MSANGSAVDHLYVDIVFCCYGVHHSVPDTCFSPSHKAVVTRIARGDLAMVRQSVAPRGCRSARGDHRHVARLVVVGW